LQTKPTRTGNTYRIHYDIQPSFERKKKPVYARDFRGPPRSGWELRSSGLLHSEWW